MLELHLDAGTLRTVEMGSVKTEEQISIVASRTGLSFSRFQSDIVCLRAFALSKNKVVNFVETAREFERALDLHGANQGARKGLARLLQAQGDFVGALKWLEEERQNDSSASEEARELCGTLLVQAGHLVEARAYLERAEKAFPPNGSIHYWLGRVYWLLGDEFRSNKDFAMRQALLAVKANSNDSKGFALLGSLYAERNDMDRARRSHAKAFELDGSQTDSALFLSDALLSSSSASDQAAAARLHSAVLRSSPMCKWAAHRLGAYLLTQRRADEALGAFQSMIRAAPEDPAGWEGLADSYRAQGKFMASLQVS